MSRNTVLAAFDQLLGEGYIEGRPGAGTFVSTELPDDLPVAQPFSPAFPPGTAHQDGNARATRGLARRAGYLAALAPPSPGGIPAVRAFRSGVPTLDEFPVKLWSQLVARHWRHPGRALLGHGDPLGYPPLRKALADYLGTARAIRCHPDQILIVSGSQQAFDLAARVLIDPGQPAWVEDPAYRGLVSAWTAAGVRLLPVPVDAEGLNPDAASSDEPPRAIQPISAHLHHDHGPAPAAPPLRRRIRRLDSRRRLRLRLPLPRHAAARAFCHGRRRSRDLQPVPSRRSSFPRRASASWCFRPTWPIRSCAPVSPPCASRPRSTRRFWPTSSPEAI